MYNTFISLQKKSPQDLDTLCGDSDSALCISFCDVSCRYFNTALDDDDLHMHFQVQFPPSPPPPPTQRILPHGLSHPSQVPSRIIQLRSAMRYLAAGDPEHFESMKQSFENR
jgi:hypothetical protein